MTTNAKVIFVLCLASCVAFAADAPKADVSFADTAQSTILLQQAGEDPGIVQGTFTAVMRNNGAASATLCFSLQLQDDKNKPVTAFLNLTAPRDKNCPADEIKGAEFHAYTLQTSIENKDKSVRPLSGFLIAEISQNASPKSVISKPIRLVPPVKPALSPYLFWAPFGLALACMLLALVSVWHFGLRSRMGHATWDFSQSWATNLTVAGAVVTTLLGFSGLPEYGEFMSKNSYLSLGLLFGVLVTLAPSVYNFTRRPVSVPIPDPDDATNTTGSRLEGHVFGFLLASFLTLWGVLGQLATIALLLSELVRSGPLPSSMGWAFHGVIAVLALSLLVYCDVTIYFTVKKQVKRHEASLHARMDLVTSKDDKDAVSAQKPPLPSWSLL
jgi:hypothetical protein